MDPRRRARLILIVGVLLALVAGAGTFFVISGAQQAQPPPVIPTTDVLVAARDLQARTALVAADLKVAKVNADVAPPSALKAPADALGKILMVPVALNEPILPSKFAPPELAFTVFPEGEEVTADSPHYRIVQITVPDQQASGGVIQAGDLVDVMVVFPFDPAARLKLPTPDPLATPRPPPTPTPVPVPGQPTPSPTLPAVEDITPDTLAKIVLGPIEVLARTGEIYTFRVDAAMAERFVYMQTSGMIMHLLVRHPGDERVVTTEGAYFGSVYEEFIFPLPAKVGPTLPTPAPSPTAAPPPTPTPSPTPSPP